MAHWVTHSPSGNCSTNASARDDPPPEYGPGYTGNGGSIISRGSPNVHSTLVVPTDHDAAASFAAGAEENADDDGDDIPALDPSCHGVPPSAPPFSPEAAMPHAHLSLAMGRDVLTVPSALLATRDPAARVFHLQIVTNRRA
jgi:hypothetical protein